MSIAASEVRSVFALKDPRENLHLVEDGRLFVLVPFDAREAITVQQAAGRANCTAGTVRDWCKTFHIGRRVAGRWQVSLPALAMLLDGDKRTLAQYVSGNRGPAVRTYFERYNLGSLLPKLEG